MQTFLRVSLEDFFRVSTQNYAKNVKSKRFENGPVIKILYDMARVSKKLAVKYVLGSTSTWTF